MRVKAIRIEGYGSLGGRAFEGLPAGVVPVIGPNEAGKSTLRALLTDLLYGFDPANREDHPYVPWDGNDTEAEAEIAREDGSGFVVRRKLLSSPSGRVTGNGDPLDIKNRPLPGAAAVPRLLFRGIYDLTRADMSFPVDSWDEVKDRLLGGAGESRFRPAREVAEEMEGEADGLWRPDRRGKPRAKEAAKKLKDLGEALRDAKDRDRRMRALEKEEEELAERDEKLRDARADRRARAEKIRFWSGLKGRLENRRASLDEASGIESAGGLPSDPLEWLSGRDDLIREREAALGEKRDLKETFERAAAAAGEEEERVAGEADRIGEAVRGATLLAQFREDERTRARDIEKNAEALRRKTRDLLADPERVGDLPELSPGELEARINAWRRAESGRVGLESSAPLLSPVPVPSAALPVILAAAGIAALALARLLFIPPVAYGVAAAGVIALLAAVHFGSQRRSARNANRRITGETARREKAIREAAAGEEARLAAVAEYLAPWGILEHRLREPGETLLSDVKEILDLRERGRELERAREEIARRIEERERSILDLARECAVEEADPGRAADRLQERLDEAREKARAKREAEERLPDLRVEVEEGANRLDELREERERIAEALRGLGGGDEERGAAELRAMREAARNAERIESDLRAEGHDPDALEMELAEEAAAGSAFDAEEAVRLESEAEDLDKERRDLSERRVGARKERDHLQEQPGAAEIEGEIDALREEMEELKRRRDRLVLLAAVVREADNRYRREHAPDIVKRASAYFARITGGRYDALEIDPATERDLRVFSRERGDWTPAEPPLSRGTLDQVYLALRLALVDHIEGEGEPLPLLLDEVFLHWDGARAGEGYALLEEIAARRQVFLFTCRPEALPESIAGGTGTIRLAAPDGSGG